MPQMTDDEKEHARLLCRAYVDFGNPANPDRHGTKGRLLALLRKNREMLEVGCRENPDWGRWEKCEEICGRMEGMVVEIERGLELRG